MTDSYIGPVYVMHFLLLKSGKTNKQVISGVRFLCISVYF